MTTQIRRRLGTPALLLALTAACSGDPSGPPAPIELPRALSADELSVVAGSNAFAFGLLREAAARAGDEPNVVLSPLSASMALGMTLNGAAGSTRDQMSAMLGFAGMSDAAINAAYRDLIDLLVTLDPQVEITIANSTWARQDFPFLPSFFETVATYFDAEAQTLDFARADAKDVINGWVDDRTNGRIDTIIDEIDSDDVMFLLNAVYFKGSWRTKFDASRTVQAPFRLEAGGTVEVPMMTASAMPVRMTESGGVQVAELPYGGDAFAMVVALPAEGTSLGDLVAGLDEPTWNAWVAALAPVKDAAVAMPRYELDYDAALNETLQALGMELAFTDTADFSRLSDAGGLYVQKVRQKTWLRVDEEGTEAAAATSVGVGVTSAPPAIRLDRPFLMALRERHSGTILFLGAIGDPR